MSWLSEVEARAEAATEGPWQRDRAGYVVGPGDEVGRLTAIADLSRRNDKIGPDAA